MLNERFKIKGKIRPAHILAVLFLAFVFYVGFAAVPDFIDQTVTGLQNRQDLHSFIRQTDEQYSGMLQISSKYKPLQNKSTYINFNGWMADLLGQPMMNSRVKLTNSHLTELAPESPAPEELEQAAQKIIRFYEAHSAAGGDFLFLLTPNQISKYENLLPAGYQDTTNDTADTFRSILEEAGVPCLDLREELQKESISITEAFFVTDHHWTPRTGFWAYGKILKKLEQMEAIPPVDPFYTNPQNYTFQTYEKTFLGSSGKRTGIPFAGLDDFTFILPNFETDINIRIPEFPLDLQGRFEEVAYRNNIAIDFENPNHFNHNMYALYGWSDTEITHWRNEKAPLQKNMLLIGESFGNIPFSLMSIYCSSCDEVDMRHFTEDFALYYEGYQPDIVVMQLNVSAILSEFTACEYLN